VPSGREKSKVRDLRRRQHGHGLTVRGCGGGRLTVQGPFTLRGWADPGRSRWTQHKPLGKDPTEGPVGLVVVLFSVTPIKMVAGAEYSSLLGQHRSCKPV